MLTVLALYINKGKPMSFFSVMLLPLFTVPFQEMTFILAAMAVGQGAFIQVGGFLEKRIGPRAATMLGGLIMRSVSKFTELYNRMVILHLQLCYLDSTYFVSRSCNA